MMDSSPRRPRFGVLARTLAFVTYAGVRCRPARVVVALSTIALGAAALASAFVLGASMKTAITNGLSTQYAGVDVVDNAGVATGQDSVSTGDAGIQGFSEKDQKAIGKVPKVAAYGTSFSTVAVAQVSELTRGITLDSPNTHEPFRWQGWSAGRAPTGSNEIGLTDFTLKQLHIRVGDAVAITQPGLGRFVFEVVGVVDTHGSLEHQSKTYGIVTESVAQYLSGLSDPNTLLIDAEAGADIPAMINEINAVAPRGLPQSASDIQSAGKSQALKQIDAMNAVVTALAGVSSLVAAVTAMTTAGASLAVRRRSWALLRCVGAGRRYVAAMVAGEAIIVGLVGGVIGVLAGVGLARLAVPLVGLVPGLPTLDADSFTVPGYAIWVPLLVALLLSAAGSLVPAWLAARIPPSAALQTTIACTAPPSGSRLLVAAATTATGGLFAFHGLAAQSLSHAAIGVVVLLVGFAMLLAFALMWSARALATGVPGAESKLGFLDIVRRPSAATIEAVSITLAVSMVAMSIVCLASVQSTTSARLDQSTAPDLKVGLVTGSPIAPDVVKDLGAVQGVAEAAPVSFGRDISVGGSGSTGKVVLTTGTATGEASELDSALPFGLPIDQVRDDTVYILASNYPPFHENKTVTLKGPKGKVAGLKVEYVEDLPVPTLVSPAAMKKVAKETTVNEVWLKLSEGGDRSKTVDLVTGVAILGGQLPVSGATILDLRVASAFATAQAAAVAILAIAVLVAVIGAAATAALSVSERARTHAMMRAIGLNRRGLHRLLVMRLTLVATVGALLGVIVGGLLGVIASGGVAHAIGLSPRVSVPALAVLGVVVVTVFAVRIAALVPVERASYIPPSRALSEA